MRFMRQMRLLMGMHAFGNLVDLGKIALAPATPEVRAFAKYLLRSHGKPL